jgi:choline dehydrogenase-like flavoprotein
MMPKELGGVVDSRLKVHGTRNLRVVDATVYAVAEKAADIIKEDHETSACG